MKNVRILAGTALATIALVLTGTSASAHVTVQPNSAEQGSRGRFVFRVPNESDTAGTIKIEVQTPKDPIIDGIRVQPKTGWTHEVNMAPLDPPVSDGEGGEITEYIASIVYTAQPGVRIGPNEFDEFGFTTGPLPEDQDQIAFKIVQTYDGPLADGTNQAAWVEERVEGQETPRRPEAVVTLTPAEEEDEGAAAGSSETATEGAEGESAADTSATDAKEAADSARTLGILGILFGIVALLVAGAAIVIRPKSAGSSGTEASATTASSDT